MNSIDGVAAPAPFHSHRGIPLLGLVPASRVAVVALVLALRAAMDIAYLSFVSLYGGFEVDVDGLKLAESILATLLMAAVLPRRFDKPSDVLLAVFFLVPVLPILSYYALSGQSRTYFYAVVGSFAIVAVARHLPVPTPPALKGVWKAVVGGSLFLSLGVAAWLYRAGGAQLFNLDITRVYDFRQAYNTEVSVGLFSYISRWTYKVLNVLLMAWSLFQRWYLMFLGLAVLQVFFFAVSSHKQLLVFPLLVLFLYVTVRKPTAVFWLIGGMLAIVLLGLLVHWSGGPSIIPGLVIRRLLYLPAELEFLYFDFFSANGFVYMTNSSEFSWLGEYAYSKPPPLLISDAAGLYGAWANAGFLASGYMNFGVTGMFVTSALVGILLSLCDRLSVGRLPVWLAVCIVIVPFTSLFVSSDLLTALIGHGLLLSLLVLWLVNARPRPVSIRVKGTS